MLKGLIKQKYPQLKGKDWMNQVSPEDKAAIMQLVRAEGEYGRRGGRARADRGKRDEKGRFTA